MLIAGTVALCGCSANNGTSSDIQSSSQSESQQTAEAATSEVETAEAPAESSVLADLTGTYDDVSEKFEFSDGWSNGSMFNCTWRKSNGSIFDGSMKLTIDNDLVHAVAVEIPGAELCAGIGRLVQQVLINSELH